MKLFKQYVTFIAIYCPCLILAQPTFYVDEIDVSSEEAFCVDVRTNDFTNLTFVEFGVQWDNDLINLDQAIDLTNDLILFEQKTDAINIKLSTENALTLTDNTSLFQLCFQPNNACGRAIAIKLTAMNTVLRDVGNNTTVDIGSFITEGVIKINCNTNNIFKDTTVSKVICEGDFFEDYGIAGTYIDVFSTSSGLDSIRILELKTIPFENITCPSDDTINIPNGYTHITIVEDFPTPTVLPSSCWDLVKREITGKPIINEHILSRGTTTFNYTFQNSRVTESCDYNIHVLEGELSPSDLSLALPDTTVTEGELVCLDISVNHFNSIIGYFHVLQWDTSILEFIELNNDEKVTGLHYNEREKGLLLFSFITQDFSDGLSISDNDPLYTVCFKAKKEGVTSINFFPNAANSRFAIQEFISNELELLNVAMRNGLVTVVSPSCNDITIEKNITICEGETYQEYTTSGVYTNIFTASSGCDSIEKINLTVIPTKLRQIQVNLFEGDRYMGFTAAGIYDDTLTTTNGCDSIHRITIELSPGKNIRDITICEGENYNGKIEASTFLDTFFLSEDSYFISTINLTVIPALTNEVDITICNGDHYFGNRETGTYLVTFIAANSCDSIVKVNLTVLPTKDTVLIPAICEGQSFLGRTETGLYTDIYTADNGCDSIVYINLVVLSEIYNRTRVHICEGESYENYTVAGFYRDTLTAAGGCDSIQVLELIVLPEIASLQNLTICRGENFNGNTESGIYNNVYVGANGCDSLAITNLTVLPNETISIEATICEGENLNGRTETGIYLDTLTTTTGCDSFITTNLTVLPSSDSTCATTSLFDAVKLNLLELYPNPVKDYLVLKWNGKEVANFSIVNINGQKVYENSILKKQTEISLSHLESGVYHVNIFSSAKNYYAKFIKM